MDIRGVELVHWDPPRRLTRGRIGRLLPPVGRVNNFGDKLGPALAGLLAAGLPEATEPSRLLTVGSIMHFARDGDVIWGTGVNGKVPREQISARRLDVRAVRGPITANFLRGLGIRVPDVFGDPGLLAPALLGISRAHQPALELTSLPNLHDARRWRSQPGFLDPRGDYVRIIRRIAESAHVVTSSLHGIVIADALGVPVSFVKPGEEDLLKYEDYFEGTGRRLPYVSETPADAPDHAVPPLEWDAATLLESFPRDLWQRQSAHQTSPG
ncbi:polysaccharide pyruvyl transferase family protein [Microbacterium rhizomatis]|uniref:polysaccharide pyruvyl transferase family protein n=1 Tax=Microbacterium rhizomatis TaxID=1631477 RepID=UPI001FE81F00|nr:polysaccharide pyruvyl transferase family protein [Microbacterium rhizomatis]